ncbi:MAG: hypothetical protein J5698_05820 [Bacteroidaceae bacterium]|nr:hypothetical protein [Bacteroidaceae bacterium]
MRKEKEQSSTKTDFSLLEKIFWRTHIAIQKEGRKERREMEDGERNSESQKKAQGEAIPAKKEKTKDQ